MALLYLFIAGGFFRAQSMAGAVLCAAFTERIMMLVYTLAGIVTSGLLVYLVVALLKPELFP